MRLNILLAALILFFGVMTCRNLQKTADSTAEKSEAAAPAPAVGSADPQPPLVGVPIERLPPATASRKAYLSTGWWHMNEALQASNDHVYDNYRDKWLRFYEDQTFEIIMHKKVIDKGQWNWDENTSEIYLKCNDPWLNNTWKVKDKGFVMIWIGNTDVNKTGIQARVANARTQP